MLQLPIASVAPDTPFWLCAPFGVLLLLIAAMPLSPVSCRHWWELHYPHVSLTLAILVGAYVAMQGAGGLSLLVHTVHDYISFISLVGSLFVIAGGIHLQMRENQGPWAAVGFLAASALLANAIGTTGASMVMIRPWIRMNRSRIRGYHIVFFIFIVSNVGGALTPIGDPPLFIGYLRGVPFFWLFPRAIAQWSAILALLLLVFHLFDRCNRVPSGDVDGASDARLPGKFRIQGKRNLIWLLVVVGAVFLPARYFLRELVMLAAALASHRLTTREVHERNAFSFGPIREVAFLFIGIFITMMPALAYLERHGGEFALVRPRAYYLASGSLSAVLDNAPTYATFFQLAQVQAEERAVDLAATESEIDRVRQLLGHPADAALIVAVSLGSVFFGAMTYIGNGPNFMVKAIADAEGVRTPSFVGYIVRYSVPILLPILLLGGWWFL